MFSSSCNSKWKWKRSTVFCFFPLFKSFALKASSRVYEEIWCLKLRSNFCVKSKHETQMLESYSCFALILNTQLPQALWQAALLASTSVCLHTPHTSHFSLSWGNLRVPQVIFCRKKICIFFFSGESRLPYSLAFLLCNTAFHRTNSTLQGEKNVLLICFIPFCCLGVLGSHLGRR